MECPIQYFAVVCVEGGCDECANKPQPNTQRKNTHDETMRIAADKNANKDKERGTNWWIPIGKHDFQYPHETNCPLSKHLDDSSSSNCVYCLLFVVLGSFTALYDWWGVGKGLERRVTCFVRKPFSYSLYNSLISWESPPLPQSGDKAFSSMNTFCILRILTKEEIVVCFGKVTRRYKGTCDANSGLKNK